MNRKMVALIFGALSWALPALAGPVRDGQVEAELVSEVMTIQPGESFWVALRLKMDPGWHTYYQEPGDSGIPTKISWKLPQGFQAGEIQWPEPQIIEMPPLVNYGYEGEVFLLTQITAPKTIKPGTTTRLRARADWLMCEESCIPGRADLELELPVKNEPSQMDPKWIQAFQKTRANLALPGSVPSREQGAKRLNLWLALIFSFIGGLILNLMPCVLPVLSIKILSFMNQAREGHTRPWKHGTVFAGGVIVSFWILAGLMLALRAGGKELGWGFQLQSPVVVTALAILFLLMGLNLLGVFEINVSWLGYGSDLTRQPGFVGSFMSGMLATVVATPCTAPFMGSALGFAFTQSAPTALLVFTSLGAGMAAPYVVLSCFPSLLRFVPKPGPWMKRLKQVLSVLLFATVVWLLWVLSIQLGVHSNAVSNQGIAWEQFSPERVKELRNKGVPIFIDFTAAWCLSCQVNERVAFSSKEVQQKFQELGIAAFKADWTTQDPTVTQALAQFGRNSVPLYVLYTRNPQAPPIILPELLTPKIVIRALEKIE